LLSSQEGLGVHEACCSHKSFCSSAILAIKGPSWVCSVKLTASLSQSYQQTSTVLGYSIKIFAMIIALSYAEPLNPSAIDDCLFIKVLWRSTDLSEKNIASIFIVEVFIFSYGVRLSPLGTAATVWAIVPAPDDRWCRMWSSLWNENWQGKSKYSGKTSPVQLCPLQIPHNLTRTRTRSSALGSRRLTAWAIARSCWRVSQTINEYEAGSKQGCSSKTSVDFQQTTGHNFPGIRTLIIPSPLY
jgi:hypothetical protein